MYLDAETQLEAAGAVKLSGDISENVVDLGAPGGAYESNAFVFIKVTEAFNTCTTVQADLVTDDAAALTSAPVILASTGSIARATWAAGATFVLPIRFPVTGAGMKRYVGLKWTTTGTANTTGKVKAWVATDVRMIGAVWNASGDTAIPMFKS